MHKSIYLQHIVYIHTFVKQIVLLHYLYKIIYFPKVLNFTFENVITQLMIQHFCIVTKFKLTI